jgi:transposase
MEALKNRFSKMPRARIALEAGTHSAWVSRLLEECGHEVLVANPRKLRLIYENDQKDDDVDAEYLARVARLDPKLLSPIQHRSAQAQQDLEVLRARDELVQARTKLINHVRGAVKSMGKRVPKVSAEAFGSQAPAALPEELRAALGPLIVAIRSLTEQIRQHDQWIENVAEERYPQSARLRQVKGVGPLTSVAYMLTVGDPRRFSHGRDVGAYLGLCPRRAKSGQSDPQLRISKAGDTFLRRLLVGSAHYILGPFGPDTDLRRFGKELAERGGKNAKKRAIVAVARKLSVLLHHLWLTGDTYEPLRNAKRKKAKGSPVALSSPPPGSLRSLGVGGGELRSEPEKL